jgi:hypothetical protein
LDICVAVGIPSLFCQAERVTLLSVCCASIQGTHPAVRRHSHSNRVFEKNVHPMLKFQMNLIAATTTASFRSPGQPPRPVQPRPDNRPKSSAGSSLLIVLILVGVSFVMVGSIYSYTKHTVRLNQRLNDYYLAVAAAEAATEKVLSQVNSDYKTYGASYVASRLSYYSTQTPTTTEAAGWSNFDFMDLSGQADRVEVQYTALSGFLPLGGQYGSLRGFKNRMRILANARPHSSLDGVVGSVYQDVEFTRIPIFQFAAFYNVILEIHPGADMTITGPVHCNTNIYLSPGATLTFNGDVTSSGTIYAAWNPLSPKGPSFSGTIDFNGAHDSGVSTMNLPIGTNNSPAAVHQVLELPPGPLPFGSENPVSSLGQQRYYNNADLIVVVSNSTVSVTSGRWNAFATSLNTNEVSLFVSTNVSFYSKRESKTVQAIQIDVAGLRSWNATNTSIRPYVPQHDIDTIYVSDRRTLSGANESGVRLVNGTNLPPLGLTLATDSPAYILGDYNVPPAAKGTTNTTGTLPASVAADAITILSGAWKDANGKEKLDSRVASSTTVNAAFLTGIVATTSTADSGGLHNFPRFLESWTAKTFTYNGSMICMFNSRIATGPWKDTGSANDVYDMPVRQWAWDQNFKDSSKLPPATPSLMVLVRANWRTPAAFTTNVMAGF